MQCTVVWNYLPGISCPADFCHAGGHCPGGAAVCPAYRGADGESLRCCVLCLRHDFWCVPVRHLLGQATGALYPDFIASGGHCFFLDVLVSASCLRHLLGGQWTGTGASVHLHWSLGVCLGLPLYRPAEGIGVKPARKQAVHRAVAVHLRPRPSDANPQPALCNSTAGGDEGLYRGLAGYRQLQDHK